MSAPDASRPLGIVRITLVGFLAAFLGVLADMRWHGITGLITVVAVVGVAAGVIHFFRRY